MCKMDQRVRTSWRNLHLKMVLITLALFAQAIWAQLLYSVSEELKDGAVVGNIAKDLGIDYRTLKERGFRVVSSTRESLFEVNQDNGILYLSRKIDREEICERTSSCFINVKIALEHPLEIHYVSVEIIDVNDHVPSFPEKEMHLEIWENALPGSRYQLQVAHDPDGGSNSIQHYKLSQNAHFNLEVKDRGEDGKMPVLILKIPLDREITRSVSLLLTAMDGGRPPKSGSMEITVDVLDINDNMPVFTENVYSVMVNENAPVGTKIIHMNATDLDQGSNGDIVYSLGNRVSDKLQKTFYINSFTGEITVKGLLDFEVRDSYEIDIQASDKGNPPLTADKSVMVKIVDINDNAPEIEVTSFSSSIPEDSRPGTTVALISVSDLDSGVNGKVLCSLPGDVPFKLISSSQKNVYSLVTASLLDREIIYEYDVTLVAKDEGQPPLSSIKTITVAVSDVNDNSPEFSLRPYTFYVVENNSPGASLFCVSAADRDQNENAIVSYEIWRDIGEKMYSSLININSENGWIYALNSFDFEILKTFQFQVLATDSGTPPLSSNVTVNVFIMDQNDNVPVILYPVSANGSAEGVEEIPRNVNAGHLVTKVRAYDADIGYNGWLLFSMQEVSDHTLFGLDRYTGQIRTLRSFTETDETQHKLVILVKDNGNVSLSATATVIIKVVEPKEAFAASDVKSTVKEEEEDNVTFYLIITLGSVSVLFVISIIVLIVMQCSKSTDYPSKYLQDTNYDGTLCHSIQYRSGDKRYMLVGPRMSIGSTIVPGSNRNTLVVPDHRRRPSGELQAARDPDSGSNSIQRYKLSDNDQFRLEVKDRDEDGKIPILFRVAATDSGIPPLKGNVTVNVFILDQNDNVPVILYPVSANGSAEGVEEIPRNVNAGHLVTKVRAYDADIGYNGWLLFSLQEVSDHTLFGLDRYTGQIRTLRSFTETDETQHKLVILVKDNGNVSLSATATVIIKVVEPKEAFAASDVKSTVKEEEEDNVTFYLIITLGSVSVLFVISIIVLIVMQCSKSTDYSSKYLQDTNYDGTLCHSIQYRSGDKRYMLVGPRMSIGSTIVPGSNGNTLVVPDHRRRPSGEDIQ
ncbi:protocadherin alpha-7-like [Brachyhypopomus gauderio]|uniref:protocadherin alpha-7-like n=1 Tax=Brachyhypopomus gauderio TaxID=698409 RepID=UPI004042190A